ncbi:lysozyme [Sphingobium yanoikuyae]|uniref:Lysozyme n=1 Tax=Sphingobium yanoikuyae TaxID=13690 RepID=A0A6M4GEN3_SPHYA|nr:lysozyme [Sphingobium yanoikuyae]QJR05458.1 lysozyme [Sphingobium yanoikuyae]
MKQFEGCELKAYLCPAKVWTIGWGRTTNVKRGDICTQTQADAWLNAEYDAFEKAVLKALGNAKVTPNQLGAMVSFAYNIGTGAFAKSTLLKKHVVGDYAGALKEFARWNKAKGRVLPGLVKRRAAEAGLYSK